MTAAFEQLIQHLDQREVRYQVDGDERTIWADFRGQVGTYRLAALVGDDNLFQIFGYALVRVPEGARPAVAETLVRANCGLRVGKLEMVFDEGDLRFQAAQVLPGDCLDDEVIGRLIGAALATLDMYLPAILSVIYGNETPKDAIRCVEAGLPNANDPAAGEERQTDE
jgi:hypothetical protein